MNSYPSGHTFESYNIISTMGVYDSDFRIFSIVFVFISFSLWIAAYSNITKNNKIA